VVNSNVDRQLAYQAAIGTPGVFGVENHLAVSSGGESATK
jgi:hypothetical protein